MPRAHEEVVVSARSWTRSALKPLIVAVTMTTTSLLAIVLIGAGTREGAQLTTTEAVVPAAHSSPVCIASSQHADERRASEWGAGERTAFVSSVSECMTTMHTAMMKALEAQPSADAAFAAAMAAHHRGGVDMARQLLLYGKDPALRAVALGVIAEQQAEIEMLLAWITRRENVAAKSTATAEAAPHASNDDSP
jgi:hypothetical protein